MSLPIFIAIAAYQADLFSHFFYLDDTLALEKTEEVLQKGEVAVLERICREETPEGWSLEATRLEKSYHHFPVSG